MNPFSFCDMYVGSTVRIILLVLLGIPILRYVTNFLAKICTQRFSRHIGLLIGNIVFYGGIIFIGVNVLHEFGFNVTALLGAAGVIGVAIGFASQTSVSNIISGFFLLLERPFSVGDIIKSGEVLGTAESIDLLAVRVRTFDNKLIRIPNEMVLKHSLVNLTFYPIKRVDMVVSMLYSDDYNAIKAMINNVLEQHHIFLKNPHPVVKMNKIIQPDFSNETRSHFAVRIWVNKEHFFTAGAVFVELLRAECDKNNMMITVTQIN